MSYADEAALSTDPEFTARLGAAVVSESIAKPDDALADSLLNKPGYGSSLFAPGVSSSPGMGDKYAAGGQAAVTDGDILASVQALWPRISDSLTPTP